MVEYFFEIKLDQEHLPYQYFKYNLKFQDGREGDCGVFVDLVRKCSFQFTQAQMKRFRAIEIDKNDMCICLDNFHPHGRALNPDKCDFMRKGIGKEILNHILEGLKNINAKFIYAVASTPSMKAFLEKQNWMPCNRKKTIYYCLLNG